MFTRIRVARALRRLVILSSLPMLLSVGLTLGVVGTAQAGGATSYGLRTFMLRVLVGAECWAQGQHD